MKKIIALSILLLMASLTLSPIIKGFSLEQELNQIINPKITIQGGNTLYVGGSGPGNYTTIQAAIDDSNNGDTIIVYNGIYYENLIINKGVKLKGENKKNTIIDGSKHDNVLNITADGVTITSFTIRNSKEDFAGIEIRSKYTTIKDNIISNNERGVLLYYSSNNKILDNAIKNNIREGIWAKYSSNNLFRDNTIKDNNNFGLILGPNSNYNEVKGNTITGHIHGNGINIALNLYDPTPSHHNTVVNNIISNNNQGLMMHGTTYNEIRDNTISDCNLHGIYLWDSEHNTFSGNTISNVKSRDGLHLEDADDNTISNNVISNCNENGLVLSSSDSNKIYENTIKKNSENGIYIWKAINNEIYHNNIIDNTKNVGYYDDGKSSNSWDKGPTTGGNYWSDYNGEDDNGDGIGETPYKIHGTTDKDNYPFMNQNGWNSHAPTKPTINGPASGIKDNKYEYTFCSTDPDEDNVYYWIEWGDGTNTGWVGPFSSGETIKKTHTWSNSGIYTLKAKAKDTNNVESDWSSMTITMPRTKRFNIDFFEKLSNMFHMIKQIFQYLR